MKRGDISWREAAINAQDSLLFVAYTLKRGEKDIDDEVVYMKGVLAQFLWEAP